MTAANYDDPPSPVPTVHAVEVDGELVLYDSATGRAAHLDAKASLIWQVLDGTVTVDELVGDLSDVFDADPRVVQSDLEAMLAELHELGYLISDRDVDHPPVTTEHVLPDPPSP